MSSIPQLSKIQFDRSGNRHLICVEGKAINLVWEIESLEYLPKNIKILQLKKEKEHVARSLDTEQFNSIACLKSRLSEILNHSCMGMRFYAVGSERFIWNLQGYVRSFGLAAEEINLEAVSHEVKDVYCSNCLTINSLVKSNIFICDSCGIKLEVIEHFSRLKNAYLGICADAESLEKLAEVK